MKSMKLFVLLVVSLILQPAVCAKDHKEHWAKKVVFHSLETFAGIYFMKKMYDDSSWCRLDFWRVNGKSCYTARGTAAVALLYHGLKGLDKDLDLRKKLKNILD